MADNSDHIIQILAVLQDKPLTLEKLHRITGLLVEWRGANFEVTADIRVGPFKVDAVRKAIEAIIAQVKEKP